MGVKCLIGFHSWNGCKCSGCGRTRNSEHDWSKNCDRCARCADLRSPSQHLWQGEHCSICQITLPQEVEQVWGDLRDSLPEVPLGADRCKAFLLGSLKGGCSLEVAIEEFAKAFQATPNDFCDLARIADTIWEQIKDSLKGLPLRVSACKEKLIADLRSGMSFQSAAESLVKDIAANPHRYRDSPPCYTPSCFSPRGNVCLSMIAPRRR